VSLIVVFLLFQVSKLADLITPFGCSQIPNSGKVMGPCILLICLKVQIVGIFENSVLCGRESRSFTQREEYGPSVLESRYSGGYLDIRQVTGGRRIMHNESFKLLE